MYLIFTGVVCEVWTRIIYPVPRYPLVESVPWLSRFTFPFNALKVVCVVALEEPKRLIPFVKGRLPLPDILPFNNPTFAFISGYINGYHDPSCRAYALVVHVSSVFPAFIASLMSVRSMYAGLSKMIFHSSLQISGFPYVHRLVLYINSRVDSDFPLFLISLKSISGPRLVNSHKGSPIRNAGKYSYPAGHNFIHTDHTFFLCLRHNTFLILVTEGGNEILD